MISDEEWDERIQYIAEHDAWDASRHFNVTKATVYAWARRKGVKVRKYRLCEDESFVEYVRMHYKEQSISEIAAAIGISVATVSKIARNNGFILRRRSRNADALILRAEMIAYLRQKYSLTDIGKAMGCSRQWVEAMGKYQ